MAILYYIQLALEQHGFELQGATYKQIFFNKYILQFYTICSWFWTSDAESQMQMAHYKVIGGFSTVQGSAPLISTLSTVLYHNSFKLIR